MLFPIRISAVYSAVTKSSNDIYLEDTNLNKIPGEFVVPISLGDNTTNSFKRGTASIL